MATLTFLGAVGTVTGSKYLLKVNDTQILIDCGMYQGRRELRRRNWEDPPYNPKDIDAVVLTHAHIDHTGYLPRLVKLGFRGDIFTTRPTSELAKIMLLDTAHIQEEDAEYRNRKGLTRYEKALPLYTVENAKEVFNHFKQLNYNKWHEYNDSVRFRFHNAGHILGAASIEFQLTENGERKTIYFSGDVGRYSVPFVHDPKSPVQTDYLICETTYGGEIHPPQDIFFEFANLIDDIIKRKSLLLIPAFAVGRTQQITYIINVLMKQGRIPKINIHIDSPMAVRVTDIYKRFPSYHQINHDLLRREKNVFYGKHVKLHRKRKSSKKLNKIKGPAIIMSASGMLTGGRILHHMINRLPDPKTTVLIPGFMAEGTTGRDILNGDSTVYIHKQPIEVKAKIVPFFGLSGHADSYELLHWLEPLKEHKPKMVFLTHGEKDRTEAFKQQLKTEMGWESYAPTIDETVEL